MGGKSRISIVGVSSRPFLIALLCIVIVGGLLVASIPEAEVNVSATAGYQGQADVAVDPYDPDAVMVVGSDDDGPGPTAWSSADGGDTYSSAALPLLFAGHTFAEGSEPAVTVDADGTWYATYEVHDLDGGGNPIDSSIAVARSYNGLVWEEAAIVEDHRGAGADPSTETPHIAVDLQPSGCTSYSGRLQLVWVRRTGADRAVYRSYSGDDGSTWATPLKINDGLSGAEDVRRPRVAVGPGGRVHAVWLDDLQKTIVADSSVNGGFGWGSDVNAATVTLGCGTGDCGEDLTCSGGALHGSTPALAVDTSWNVGRGTVYIAFADDPLPAGDLDVFVISSVDGGVGWSSPAPIGSVTAYQEYGPALAVHPVDGSLHAVWYDRAGNSDPACETRTWHAVSVDGGASWIDETAVSSAVSDYDGDPRGEGTHVAVAAAGTRVFPVWTDDRAADHEIYLGRIARAGGTLVRGGSINTDTTWLAADGPFLVTGDQTIAAGATLTIEAGTEVRMATCDDLHSGVDASRVEIIVDGVLDVAGTAGNTVRFQSGDPAPAKADWYGIRFQNTADSSSSTLNHAAIQHATYGIRLSSASPTLQDVEIDLASTGGLEGTARNAVPFSLTRVTVTDAGTPVSLANVSGTWTDVTLQDSTGPAGTVNGGSLELRLVGMRVLNNAGGGLITNLSGGLEVILSEFSGNGVAQPGLTVNGYGPRTLVANDFTANVGDGLKVDNDSSGWPSVAVYASNFVANGGAAVRMMPGSRPADARRSHWGALEAEMTGYPKDISGIWDIHDDAGLAHVDFRQHQGSPVANDGDLESYLAVPGAMNDNEAVIYGGAVARNGVLRVEVSTDGGSTWFDATVDGAAFSYYWAPAPGTYTVMSRVTDSLMNVEVVPDQVTVNVGTGPTLSGTLLADETWSGGPIVLEGDVVVPAGISLTVDPGTVVHAQYLTDNTYGGLDPSRIEIIVQGVLKSNGAPGNETVWESSRVGTGALKGDWYGIRYLDTTTDALSVVQHTEIGHGVNGVKLESAAPDVFDSTIHDCSLDGLSGSSGSLAKALWVLSGNTIQDNDGDGVDVTGSTEVEVLGASITGNGGRGLDIDAGSNVVTVTDATMSGNGAAGIFLNSGGTGFILLDSVIDSNGGDGVYVNNAGTNNRMERLTISNNAGNGIYVVGGSELVLLKSLISGNQRGLRIGSPRLVAAYNSITGNTGNLVSGYQGSGVYYYTGSGAPAVLGMNDLDNVVDYGVYLTTSRSLKARRNYWGAATTANMNAAGFPADLGEFYDIHDNRGYGVVDYDNWAAASVAGAAPGDLAAHITWPGDAASLNVSSVVLSGVAYAAAGIDRVEICVRKQGVDPPCGDAGTPFGVVTGKEAWTFEWFPPSSGTFELEARVVDTGNVKSAPSETITYSVTVLGPTVMGPVAISGPVIGDQTWSGDIELTGDVVVEAGHTLTLLPGTHVRARTLADDRLGGEDTSRIELIVRGNLVTQGTGGSPVTLSSTRMMPEKRDWYGIRFETVSDASLNDLAWTSVEAGWHGLEFRDTFAALDEVSSSNNYVYGLYLSSSTALFPATAAINGGSFLDNGTNGMYLYSVDGTWTLDGVEIGNNGSYGLYIYACNADGPFTMDGVNIHDNVSYGAYLYSCGRPVNVLSSTFDANVGTGFFASNPDQTTIRASTFSNHTDTALVLSYPAGLVLSKNTFSGNKSNASVSNSSNETEIVFNEFGPWTNLTDQGLTFAGVPTTTSRNAHFNNFREQGPGVGDVILRNAVAAGVNARANYWDPDTTTEMDTTSFPANITSIADVEDNPAWGRVDYRAHRSAAVNLAPPQVCGFTNPVDGDALTGLTFTLRGAAAADDGIQVVEISTDSGSTWMPATGEELWTYEWTPPGSGNYTLQCRVTDNNAAVQALPASINVDVMAAAVTTSGTLTGDEAWSGVIVLTGDVTVPAGITLTILEGTTVKAVPQSDDKFGGVDTSRIELIVQGALDLQGSAALPVTFTSNRVLPAVPTAGDWYGIRLLDTADSTLAIHDAVIEAAVRGIWGYPGSHHDIQDCVVRDMTQDGMYLQFGSDARDVADPGIEISGNTVERTGSGYYGIYLQHSGSNVSWNDAVNVVDNNTLNDTGSYGIYISTGYAARTEVANNNISTAGYGIYLYGSNATSYTNREEVTGNHISDASSWALYFYAGRSLLADGNTVTGGGYGMYAYVIGAGRIVRNNLSGGLQDAIVLYGAGVSNITLHRNQVTAYGSDGLVASSLASLVALYNSIGPVIGDAVQLSVVNAGAQSRIHWNNIQGSGGYDASLSGAIGADLRRNYWDATNAEMIAEGYPSEISEIHDIEDYDAYGRVDYRGVELAPVGTAVNLESRFVWPSDGDTMSRRSITLEGTAYADAGVQMVEISTDGGATWMPATGADLWTFPFTPASDGPQVFLSRVTDMDSNVEPTPDAITVTFDSALPTTEGTLPGDETWTGPAPIILTGDIIVPVGTTLTIDPGTTLRAQPLADNSHGGVDLSRIELIVEGTLDLQGTSISPVTFTSGRSPTPLAGDWYGIRLTDTADSSASVHDLVVEFGLRGIWGYPGSHQDIRDCVVRDMTQDGMYLQFGSSARDVADPGIEISGNTVERTGSGYYGIFLQHYGTDPSWNDAVNVVDNNTTNDTGSYGLYIGTGFAERTEVADNHVSTASYGIYLYGNNSTSYTNREEVTGNQVSDASSWALSLYAGRSVLVDGNNVSGGNSGIYSYSVGNGRITHNSLAGGSGAGMTLTAIGGNSDMFVHRNSVSGYGGDGLYSTSLANLVALYNTITNVGGDALESYTQPGTTSSVPQVHWNNIDGSTGYDARVSGAAGSDVRRNYWTGTNAEMLAEGYPAEISEIYDIEDNIALGRVDYGGVESVAVDTNVTLESRFVWPFDGDTMSRRSITLAGTAYADAGVQLVEISTDGGSSWAPATGADVWTFPFTPVADGPQEFRCRVTDGGSNVETTPDILVVTFDSSLPTTEGTIPGDETWSGTVLLTGDVVVPAGRTLTIDPGTIVQVQPLADDSRGGVDSSRIELIVQGTLVAQGVGPGSIQMSSASLTPAKGHWYGIRYDGTPRALTELRNLSLDWVMKGISETSGVGVPDMDGISVQHAQEDGIRAASAPPGGGDWTFRNVQISLADMNGLRIDTGPVDADVVLEDLLIENVGREALYLGLDPAEDLTVRDATLNTSTFYNTMYIDGPHDTLLERVAIHHSNPSGDALSMTSSHVGDLLSIDDSEITGGNHSVYLYRVAYPTIRRSRITGGGTGVYLLGYLSLNVDAVLEDNRISDTSADGVYIGTVADATLHRNDLYNIAGYALNNQSANDIDAADNYWGEDTKTEMNAKGCGANIAAIYDQYDNASKGLVTYCNYATEPFGDQPTILFHDNAGQYEIHWNPKGGLAYDLIRGDLGNLAVAGAIVDVGAVTCDAAAIGGGVAIDPSPDPPASGDCWFYLMRDHTTPGTYGQDPAGRERVPSSGDCP